MAWVKVDGLSPTIAITTGGRLVWNDAAHGAMGCPEAVEVFHDAAQGRLGIRRIKTLASTEHGLEVHVVEEVGRESFAVEAWKHLQNIGVSVEALYVAALEAPAPPVPPNDNGDEGVWWFALPG